MIDIFEWKKYLKDNLEFPFLAEVCEYQEDGDILILGDYFTSNLEYFFIPVIFYLKINQSLLIEMPGVNAE